MNATNGNAIPASPPAPHGMAGGPAPAAPGGSVPVDPAIEEQRRKWREKAKLAYARKKAGGALAGPALPPAPAVPGQPPAPAPGPVAVPWDQDLLKPLFAELVPAAERASVGTLTAKASKISAELASEVARDTAWPEASRLTIISEAPKVVAKWLNSAGIGAEHAPEAALLVAVGHLVTRHYSAAAKLDASLARIEKARTEPAAKPESN